MVLLLRLHSLYLSTCISVCLATSSSQTPHLHVVYLHGDVVPAPRGQPVAAVGPEVVDAVAVVVAPRFFRVVVEAVGEIARRPTDSNVQN